MAAKDVSFLLIPKSPFLPEQPLEYQFQTPTHLQTLLSLEFGGSSFMKTRKSHLGSM